MKDVTEYSVKWTRWDSYRECLKFDKVGNPSSSALITANNYQSIVSGRCTASNSHQNTSHFLPNPLGQTIFITGRD